MHKTSAIQETVIYWLPPMQLIMRTHCSTDEEAGTVYCAHSVLEHGVAAQSSYVVQCVCPDRWTADQKTTLLSLPDAQGHCSNKRHFGNLWLSL